MRRIAFTLEVGSEWLGGVNYLRNLIGAVQALPNRHIEPVLLTSMDAVDKARAMVPGVEVVGTHLVGQRRVIPALARRLRDRLGRNWLLERVLERNNIDLLSHSGFLGKGARIPALGWIPDFQHKFLPQLFTEQECAARDTDFQRLASLCTGVVLSSETARGHFRQFFPKHAAKAHLLRFVAPLSPPDSLPSREELEAAYGFRGQYVYLPNQFWKHKNHIAVIRALEVLRRTGRRVMVLSTGKAADHRGGDHVAELVRATRDGGLAEDFRMLGVVPYPHMVGLLRHAAALVNPSLFEGWSTTVEEGKSMGKTIVLSDIPVHREQAPPGGLYFDPNDPEALAEVLWEAWEAADPAVDDQRRALALAQLPERFREFGETYQRICLSIIDGGSAAPMSDPTRLGDQR